MLLAVRRRRRHHVRVGPVLVAKKRVESAWCLPTSLSLSHPAHSQGKAILDFLVREGSTEDLGASVVIRACPPLAPPCPTLPVG